MPANNPGSRGDGAARPRIQVPAAALPPSSPPERLAMTPAGSPTSERFGSLSKHRRRELSYPATPDGVDFGETDALIDGEEADGDEQPPADVEPPDERPPLADRPETPLPLMQLFILVLMRISEPISFTVVFPFVNDQVAAVLPVLPRAKVGFYSGLIESAFAVVQVFVVLLWGRASDVYGRKPILLIGITGTAISITIFGLSRSFVGMVLSRVVAGLMNGNIGVLKATVAEITDETNQARAFALIPLTYAIGSIIGPALGGALSDPLGVLDAQGRFPPDSDTRLLARYPFLLPCLVASTINVLAIVLGVCFLRETHPRRKRVSPLARSASGRRHADASVANDVNDSGFHGSGAERQDEPEPEPERKAPPLRSLLTKQVLSVLMSQTLLNFLNIAYAALLPLFCYTRIADGGIAFTRKDIATIMGSNGLLSIFMQLLILPWLIKRAGGPLRLFRIVVPFLAATFLCFPLAQAEAVLGHVALVWAVLGAAIVLKTAANSALVCATLLVNNSAPSREALGAMNGLSSMCAAAARAIGPAGATSLFALSAEHGHPWTVWFVGAAISLCAWSLTFRIRPVVPTL